MWTEKCQFCDVRVPDLYWIVRQPLDLSRLSNPFLCSRSCKSHIHYSHLSEHFLRLTDRLWKCSKLIIEGDARYTGCRGKWGSRSHFPIAFIADTIDVNIFLSYTPLFKIKIQLRQVHVNAARKHTMYNAMIKFAICSRHFSKTFVLRNWQHFNATPVAYTVTIS